MDRALVVIDDTDNHRRLLAEAGRLANGTGAELVLFSWTTPEEYEETLDAIESIERTEGTSYGEMEPTDAAKRFAIEFADSVLDDVPVEYRVAAVVSDDDDRADDILQVAEREDCDHVFLVGRKRSPTGKALFGDVAQRVLLNFEGLVTVSMR